MDGPNFSIGTLVLDLHILIRGERAHPDKVNPTHPISNPLLAAACVANASISVEPTVDAGLRLGDRRIGVEIVPDGGGGRPGVRSSALTLSAQGI